ncbi:MAG: hypothetical protein H6R13_1649 [Proteobacteria bacterium]|nr:hypothetical protein [Pseudomonadota bacterium]
MKYLWLIAALFAPQAQAYSPDELRGDCQAAEEMYARQQKSSDPFQSIRSARCIAYVAGFADSYAVSDYLAEKIGVKLNAFCLPNDPDLSLRLVRAGGIGRRSGFKIRRRKVCQFESGPGHQ